MATPNPRVDTLTEAVLAVVSAVLGREEVGADDDLETVAGLDAVVRTVTLLNQWLGTELATWQALEDRTPRGLAATLASAGAVVPAMDATAVSSGPTGPTSEVDDWQRFWEATYRFSGPEPQRHGNTAGWTDSVSLTPLPAAAMREWARSTVDRAGLVGANRIVDVGCGTGLILFQLAARCSSYVGIDFSVEAVHRVRAAIDRDPAFSHVRVVNGAATDLGRLVPGGQDLILLNSVIQYFPDQAYLEAVLRAASDVLVHNGSVYLGDVRNRSLQRAHNAALLATWLDADTTVAELRDALVDSIAGETELLLSPGDVVRIVHGLSLPCPVRILARRGAWPTEMNRFRFDVLLSPRAVTGEQVDRDIVWANGDGERAANLLAEELAAGHGGLILRSVPDARTHEAVRLVEAIESAPADAPVHDVWNTAGGPAGLDPEDAWTLGDSRGYGVAVAPAASPGFVDLAFAKGRDDWAAAGLLSPCRFA